jgi:hypothetical protein
VDCGSRPIGLLLSSIVLVKSSRTSEECHVIREHFPEGIELAIFGAK